VAGEITGVLPSGITLIDASDPERPGPDGRPVLVIGHDDSGALSVLWVYSALAAGSWDVAFGLIRRADS
jgi:hypothetical protein